MVSVICVCIICVHRLTTGINSRPTVCIVCLASIHFIQQAAKCQGSITAL